MKIYYHLPTHSKRYIQYSRMLSLVDDMVRRACDSKARVNYSSVKYIQVFRHGIIKGMFVELLENKIYKYRVYISAKYRVFISLFKILGISILFLSVLYGSYYHRASNTVRRGIARGLMDALARWRIDTLAHRYNQKMSPPPLSYFEAYGIWSTCASLLYKNIFALLYTGVHYLVPQYTKTPRTLYADFPNFPNHDNATSSIAPPPPHAKNSIKALDK